MQQKSFGSFKRLISSHEIRTTTLPASFDSDIYANFYTKKTNIWISHKSELRINSVLMRNACEISCKLQTLFRLASHIKKQT